MKSFIFIVIVGSSFFFSSAFSSMLATRLNQIDQKTPSTPKLRQELAKQAAMAEVIKNAQDELAKKYDQVSKIDLATVKGEASDLYSQSKKMIKESL